MKSLIAPFNWREVLENKEVYSIGNDFVLFDTLTVKPPFDRYFNDYYFKLDVAIGVICIRGTMKGTVNLKHYSAKAPGLFIVLPEQILQYEYLSEDYSGLFIIMSKKFTDSLFQSSHERFPLLLSVNNNPWTPLNEDELALMVDFYTMVQKIVREKDHPYRTEIVKHLIYAFFYGLGYQYLKIPENDRKSKQALLVEKFLNYAQANYKEQRGMEFYADMLCMTPKHMSKVIKETSGVAASDWIDNYVVLEAKALLNSTNMTIQQISDELNFPSQSFFGKYFKRHVGVSPKEYRKK